MKNCAFLLFAFLLTQTLHAQQFSNLDFELKCTELAKEHCSWTKSWGKEDCCSISADADNHFLTISAPVENAVGFIEQEVIFPSLTEIKILEVSAVIQSQDIIGKGAGINIAMYDDDGVLISNKDMGGFYSLSWITGTNDWQAHSLKTICPIGTSSIKIGAILYGKGVARFDDFKVAIHDLKNRDVSLLAKDYVADALKYISENSLVRDSLDLKGLNSNALSIAGDATSPADCYLAVEFLLESLRAYGDVHSYFMTAEESDNWANNDEADGHIDLPEVDLMDNVGYILVPPFHGGNVSVMMEYANSLQQGLKKAESKSLKGWVVDLRQNTGGNMEPMITGLGPLFDKGRLGYLVDINGEKAGWCYHKGKYQWEDETGLQLDDAVKLKKRLPIAVLTSARTGSSGEIVVISFIGNTSTKSFGQNTWGLTTGNGEFKLSDGAKMLLASTMMADRNGNIYTSFIAPDVTIPPSENSEEDAVLLAAISWILNRR